MFELLLGGFGAVFSLEILVLVTVGVAVGIVFGAVPGLTAVMAIALCLPLTFTMGPAAGLSLLVALYIGATSGGLISAILLKIPGTPAARTRCWCGFAAWPPPSNTSSACASAWPPAATTSPRPRCASAGTAPSPT